MVNKRLAKIQSHSDGETGLLAQVWSFEAGVPYNNAMACSNK